uniref:Endonuclease/exonuclease/phosphatase domain-containing protein n=1 Tax=Lactuca sativa TaxID=4236 RepID=A0A9R1V5K3_LACSA|nr:hypothetical protein LSAT_V11C600310030 [Lactuca sativa]
MDFDWSPFKLYDQPSVERSISDDDDEIDDDDMEDEDEEDHVSDTILINNNCAELEEGEIRMDVEEDAMDSNRRTRVKNIAGNKQSPGTSQSPVNFSVEENDVGNRNVVTWELQRWRQSTTQMNVMSLNVRGLGEKYKTDWVCRLRRDHKLCMIGLQETKLGESSPPFNAASCWGDTKYGFEQVLSNGRSGGSYRCGIKTYFP